MSKPRSNWRKTKNGWVKKTVSVVPGRSPFTKNAPITTKNTNPDLLPERPGGGRDWNEYTPVSPKSPPPSR